MPEIISCPDCDRKLRVPEDLLGKKVKCPGCGVTFTASAGKAAAPSPPKASARPSRPPVDEGFEETPRAKKRPAAPPPEEDEDDDDRGRGRGRGRGRARDDEEDDYEDRGDEDAASPASARVGWRKVRLGITLIITAIFVGIGGQILVFLLAWMGGASMSFGIIRVAQILGLLVGYATMALELTGHGMNMAIPPRRGVSLRGLAITTFSLYAAWAGMQLLSQVIGMIIGVGLLGGGPFGFPGFGGGPGGFGMGGVIQGIQFMVIVSVVAALCALAGWFCFLFLLRGIVLGFGKPALAKTIVSFMITAVSVVVGGFLMACIGGLIFGAAMFNMGMGGGGMPNPQAAANAGVMGGVMAIAFMCIMIVVALALLVWYIVILFQVRSVIDSHLRRR